jgi:hypothetical protein
MGLTVRSDKQVNAEVYLEQDGNDVNICIATPNGKTFIVAYFSSVGQFATYGLNADGVKELQNFVILDDNLLSVL